MKIKLLIFGSLLAWCGLAVSSTPDPAILVQSRFSKEWSQVFLNHLRSVVIQNEMTDPYERTIESQLVFDLGSRLTGLTEDGQEWYLLLQKFLKIDLLKSDFRLVIDRFHYKVENLDAAISPSSQNASMLWTMEHNVQDLGLGAEKMSLQVSLHSSEGEPIVFNIDLMGATLELEGLTVPVQAVWRSIVLPDEVAVVLEKVDLRDALRKLQFEPNKVNLNFKDIIIPPLELRVGSRRVVIDPTQMRDWIIRNKEKMKRFLLDVMVIKNIDVFEDMTGEDELLMGLPRNFFAPGEKLSAAVSLENLIGTQTHVRARMNGVFCNPREATDLKSCLETAARNPRTERAGIDYEASLRKIFADLERNDANIIVSLSETYLNQAATASIEAGLMTEAFGEGEISLGSGGVTLHLDTEGDIFHGYLHLNNRLSGWDRRLSGRSLLTFPIRLGLHLRLEQKAGVPTLLIDVAEALAPTSLLLSGAPEIGMASNIATVPRFRGKVIDKVQAAVKKFQGQRLAELPLPFLKGTFFEKTQFKSDGFGRANALFKVEEKRLFK
jgi:hypothetical protein